MAEKTRKIIPLVTNSASIRIDPLGSTEAPWSRLRTKRFAVRVDEGVSRYMTRDRVHRGVMRLRGYPETIGSANRLRAVIAKPEDFDPVRRIEDLAQVHPSNSVRVGPPPGAGRG